MTAISPRLVFDLRRHETRGRKTTCTLAIFVDGEAVWPVRGEETARLDIQIDDLLAHLTDYWKPLMLRQVYPIDVTPLRPSDLRRHAELRWTGLPSTVVELEEEAVSRFERAHDISHAFAGLYGLPAFWILRAGPVVIIETADRHWRLPFDDVRRALALIGDRICALLAAADLKRWEPAIDAWKDRNTGDAVGLLAWSTGLTKALAGQLIQEAILAAPRDFEDAAADADELRIAARMAGALPPDQIYAIIGLARQFPPRPSVALRNLAATCLDRVARHYGHAAAFLQGEVAAQILRNNLGLATDKPVDVFDVATTLGIEIRHAAAEPPTLDGLAIWGQHHGPGVFLNDASGRILRPGDSTLTASPGARVTLAHELCHLLLDGDHAVSAVDVLKARMPVTAEQRAKSFAGEFLLPTATAGHHWGEAGHPVDRAGLTIVVEALMTSYGVTRSVAAWKIEHAAREREIDLSAVLDAVAPRR